MKSSSLRTQGPIRRAVDIAVGIRELVEPAHRYHGRRGLWVPAFAGTTGADLIFKQQTRLRILAARCARVLRRLQASESSKRAQGKPGARCTRDLVCKNAQKNAHEHTGSAEAIRLSLRSGLRLIPCSPR